MKPKKCKKCACRKIVKYGKYAGKQRFQCTNCKLTFSNGNQVKYPKKIVEEAIELHNESMTYRAIARRLKVGKTTIQNWIKKRGNQAILIPPERCETIEIDELQFFLGKKGIRRWLWLAVCRTSRKILAVEVGRRSKKAFAPMLKKLAKITCNKFCTDGYQVYNSMLPERKHRKGKQHTFTVEGMMSVVRHFLARFRRKTRCYTRSEDMAKAAVLVFAKQWNDRRN